LPGAVEDEGVEEGGAVEVFAGVGGAEGPGADSRVGIGEIEGFNGEPAEGFDGVVVGVVDDGFDFDSFVAGLGRIEVGAAGEATELNTVCGGKLLEARFGKRGDGAGGVGFQSADLRRVALLLRLELGDLGAEGIVGLAKLDVGLTGRGATGREKQEDEKRFEPPAPRSTPGGYPRMDMNGQE